MKKPPSQFHYLVLIILLLSLPIDYIEEQQPGRVSPLFKIFPLEIGRRQECAAMFAPVNIDILNIDISKSCYIGNTIHSLCCKQKTLLKLSNSDFPQKSGFASG